MRKRFAIAMLLVLSLSCSIPQPFSTQTAVVPQEGSVLRIYAGLEAPILDPARVEADTPAGMCIPFLFTPLTELDSDGNVVSNLAENWESSQDNRLWTFHLRPDFPWVKYNPETGKAEAVRNITAHDVEYSVKRKVQYYLSGDEQISDSIWTYFNIKGASGVLDGSLLPDRLGIRAENDLTLKVELEQPDANFPLQGRQIFALAEESTTQNIANWTPDVWLLTNGPYVPQAESNEDRRTNILVKNPLYPLATNSSVEKIEIVSGVQPEIALEMYKKGELDILPVQPAYLPAIRQDPVLNKDLYLGPRVKQVALVFNTAKPPFDNPNLVKAFSLAIDREKIMQSGEEVLTCNVSKSPVLTSGETWNVADWYLTAFSPEVSKLALDFSGMDFAAPDSPGITMSVSDDPELKAVAESLQTGWNNLSELPFILDGHQDIPQFMNDPGGTEAPNIALVQIRYDRLIEDTGALYITGDLFRTARNGQIAILPLYANSPDAIIIGIFDADLLDSFALEFAGFIPAANATCPEIISPTTDEMADQCMDTIALSGQDFEKHDCEAWIPRAQEAALQATRALDLDVNNARALLCRGEAFHYLDRQEQALADLKLARDLRTSGDEKRLDQLLKEVRELAEAPACRITPLQFFEGYENGKPVNPSDTYSDSIIDRISVFWAADPCDGVCRVVWYHNDAQLCWHNYGSPEIPHNPKPGYEGSSWSPDSGLLLPGKYTVEVICGANVVGSITGNVP